MSNIKTTFNKNILVIENIKTKQQEKIDVTLLEHGLDYESKFNLDKDERNKLFLLEEIEPDAEQKEDENKNELIEESEDENDTKKTEKLKRVVLVYSENGILKYTNCGRSKAYKRLVKVKYKILRIKLNKRKIKICLLAFIINKYNMKINTQRFYIDELTSKECELKQYKNEISKIQKLKDGNIVSFNFKVKDLIKDESKINSAVKFAIDIDGYNVNYRIAKRIKNVKRIQHYYAPFKATWTKDFAIHIRRDLHGNLVLVDRQKETIERTLKFRIFESKPVSSLLYSLSKILTRIRNKKINVFYEKFASKAEEGSYDLFLLIQKENKSKNYFVISEDSPDYQKIKENRGVVRKYSLKYYWIIYNANNFISTEAPIHLNIIRSNNMFLRKSLMDKPFIFLQHGITYLKCQGKNSTFAKNKEGEVTYIVVGSEKEKKVVVESLNISEEQVLKTGLPIFDKVKYNHINQESDDFVTVMLTWKPYEEQLYHFEESSYYKNVIEICDMLKKYIDKTKILIIAHPKAQELIEHTDLKDALWNEPISKALEKTKLLITDYSSVCYNSFYQGAGVIFYQPDLELYEEENGPLIPADDEYIGKRAFDINELEQIVKSTIIDNKIDLSKVRTKEHEKIYKTINEFSDGKNGKRIYDKLVELKLV